MTNKIIGVIGPKRSGKTHSVTEFIMTQQRLVAFDVVHESGYLCCEPFTGTPKALAAAMMQEEFRLVYRPTFYELDDDGVSIKCPVFEPIVTLCYLRGNMTLVIDEAHLLCTRRRCPKALLISNFIGGHRGLNIAYIGQSFAAITIPLTRNTDEFWFWRISEPADLDAIAARCGSETRDRVANLRKLDLRTDGTIIPGEMLKWNVWEGIVSVQ